MANITAHSSTLVNGTVNSGSLSDTFTQNDIDYVLNEPTGAPSTEIEFEFTITGTASKFWIFGRYTGNQAHNINVDAWNGASWDNLGTWPEAGADALSDWTLLAGHTISGNVKVRLQHTSPGNPTHRLNFDYVYITNGTPERMSLTDGTNMINFSPLVSPAYIRPDSRNRGNFQASDKTIQLWDTGGAHRGDFTLNDIPKSCADQLNDWWRDLTILTYTPNTDEAGTTLQARISPAGQKPFQMWFDTGYHNQYTGTVTIVETSSSSSA